MASLSPKDRASLCQFSFADGRRCRTPRTGNHPHFCFDHAQKEARALAEAALSKDLAYFFSGDYLSACDLSTALGRLIPAVICGHVKPRAARTVAYMAQTLLQTIHLAQHEYTNTFGSNGWRNSICHSVNSNYNHRFPNAQRSAGLQADPVPQPAPPPDQAPVVAGLQTGTQPASPPPQAQQPASQPACPEQGQTAETPAGCHSERSEESAFSSSPAPSPHTPLPTTGGEFAQQLLAGRQTGSTAIPGCAPQMTATKNPSGKVSPPEPTSANGHSERSAPSAFPMNLRNGESASASSSNSSLATHHSPLPPASPSTPSLTPNKDASQQFYRTHRHLP